MVRQAISTRYRVHNPDRRPRQRVAPRGSLTHRPTDRPKPRRRGSTKSLFDYDGLESFINPPPPEVPRGPPGFGHRRRKLGERRKSSEAREEALVTVATARDGVWGKKPGPDKPVAVRPTRRGTVVGQDVEDYAVRPPCTTLSSRIKPTVPCHADSTQLYQASTADGALG